jgi:hypothetical protein
MIKWPECAESRPLISSLERQPWAKKATITTLSGKKGIESPTMKKNAIKAYIAHHNVLPVG